MANTLAQGDFIEGVRALIVDKDNTPQWRAASFAAVDDAAVQALFRLWWAAGEHPHPATLSV